MSRYLLLVLSCFLLSSCAPQERTWETFDNTMKAYLRDEGLGLSGYVYREEDLRLKVGEISSELLLQEIESRENEDSHDPYFRLREEDIKDEGFIFGITLEKRF